MIDLGFDNCTIAVPCRLSVAIAEVLEYDNVGVRLGLLGKKDRDHSFTFTRASSNVQTGP